MQIAPKEFTVNNEKMVFRAISGTVKSTEQRSDSYTYGAGKSAVIIGQHGGGGGGSSYVDTKVIVTRDIFIEDGDRQHNIRIQADIPLAAGHDISAVVLERGGSDTYFSIANRTLGNWRQVGDDPFTSMRTYGPINWAISFVLSLAFSFAIRFVPALILMFIFFSLNSEFVHVVALLATLCYAPVAAYKSIKRALKWVENEKAKIQQNNNAIIEFVAMHKQFVQQLF